MAPARRKQTNRAQQAKSPPKNLATSPGNRRSKRKTNVTKTLANEKKLSIGSPKTSQTTLKDYYENFFKSDLPQSDDPLSREKIHKSPDRNTPSISVEEMCVKMTLDEFHYNTNIIELIKEYWLQQNHPEKVLQKMMYNLDFYIERVYNRYIRKPKFRHDDLFKNLKILPVSIDMKDVEDNDSKITDIQRNRKNNNIDQKRKRKAQLQGSSSESNLSYEYISDDTSCDEINLKSLESANKKRKVIKSQTRERQTHLDNSTFEEPMANNDEILNKASQLGKKLRRCPSPQEGCSKWLYPSVPSENSDFHHLNESSQPINVDLPEKNANPRRYAANLSPTQIEEICSSMSLNEFKAETNIIDIIKERTTPSNNSAAKVDNYAERIYDNCIKNKYKRRHDLFIDLKITEKAVDHYKRCFVVTKPAIVLNPTQDIFDTNSVKEAPSPLSKKRKHNITNTEQVNSQQVVKHEPAKLNLLTDSNQIARKDTMVVIPVANLRDSNALEPSTIEEITQLNKQGILMTRKPCPLSKKMKYVLEGKLTKSSQEKFIGDQHPKAGEDNTDKIPNNLSSSNRKDGKKISSNCMKESSSEAIPVKTIDDLNQTNISVTDNTTSIHDNHNRMNIQNINDLPRASICRLAEGTATTMESQKLHGTVRMETLTSSVAQDQPSNTKSINTKSSLHSSSTTVSTTSNDENLTAIHVEHESAVPEDHENNSKITNICVDPEDESVETPIKVETHNISDYIDEIEFLPSKDQTIISITDELTNTEAMLNEIFMPTDIIYSSIPRPSTISYFTTQNENNSRNEDDFSALPNESPLTSNLDQANDNVIISSGSSSEVPPSPEIQDNYSVRTTKPVEETQDEAIENAKLPIILSCVNLSKPNHVMKRSYPKSFKRKSPSKFSPLEFLPNTQTASSAKPKARKIIETQVSDEVNSLEDLIEEEITQEVIDNSQMVETIPALQTNSQLLNADLTYLQNAKFPSPVKKAIAPPEDKSQNKTDDLPESDRNFLADLPHNVELPATLNRPLRHKNFTCLTCLDIRKVVFGEHVNRLNYESNSPFLEKSKDKQVRATIKVNLGRCRSLHIVGETLQILLGLTNKEWQCVMKLFDVIEHFEFQSTDPEPTNKSLPYRILYYLFKTLPKFSQATLESVATGSHDQVSCVTMNINYFKPIQSLKQAFHPIILEKLKTYNAISRTS